MATPSRNSEILFEEVCSIDFLKFSFGGRGYQDQLYDAIAKTNTLAGVKVECLTFPGDSKIVWVTHNFGFLGGSLGCAEGEKITRAFEYGLEHKVSLIIIFQSVIEFFSTVDSSFLYFLLRDMHQRYPFMLIDHLKQLWR